MAKPIKVYYEYDGQTYEITANAVSLDYIPVGMYGGYFNIPIYYETEGKFTCNFIGKPKVLEIKAQQLEESTETYFGEQVQFIFMGNRTVCFLIKNNLITDFVGVANCKPEDKYNRDYGKLLSYQRAKEKQLYGSVK